ncbi:NADPH-dependent F420 reductase [Labrys wisconsinensis]|uniref:Dinucleotide-binding enzyme n=1 Tax=Labrys wisconsinensis TaxID=425677 RepID=A0ABU0JAM6_9HYPH|nr:NAD(P)-binding domain-containing protein [Labrys wisconsinensis]MDQ0471322.1 putative dinucleotide-binding enzyme [Labrys wisconsinensis]
MKIGIIGSGVVGQTLGARLAARGHDVRLGLRTVSESELDKPRAMAETLRDWRAKVGVGIATFAEAARHGEIVFAATAGGVTVAALAICGAEALAGKVVIDVSNPLDFSTGALTYLPQWSNTTSVGEEVQKAFPAARVVKTLNTVNIAVGVDASQVPGEPDMFVAGNDAAAKAAVTDLLRRDFAWRSVIDLGDIGAARGMEQTLALWFRLMQTLGTPQFGLKVLR